MYDRGGSELKGTKVFSRLRLSLVACLVLVAAAAIAVSTAGAAAEQPPADASGLKANMDVFNPQESNVPYLAWNGENVRLVKCTHDVRVANGIGGPTSVTNNSVLFSRNGLDANYAIYAYSGPQENSFDGPKAVTTGAAIFRDGDRYCVRASFISNKPGIVIVKFTLAYQGILLAQHDFMVGWMDINSAAITNPGSVTENPGDEPGNSVNAQVTGKIPVNSQFQGYYGLPSQLVMPNDWARWANAMATTDDNLSGLPASAYWDIHDSSGPQGNESPDGSPDVHVDPADCAPGTVKSLFVDQVDNCNGTQLNDNAEGPFSRIFGDLVDFSGPFDPSYSDSLLSDGRLNSSDAPMPAMKIVFNSAGGMGGFVNGCLNDKDNAYNRNFDPSNIVPSGEEAPGQTYDCIADGTSEDAAHAQYAPYYNQYIPATSRDPFGAASGVDGPIFSNITGQPNNFAGFGWYGLYENWQIAKYLVQNVASDTECRLRDVRGQDTIFRQTNGLPTSIIEFTDEHGEARANWQPGLGNDNFGTSVGFVDQNGGCDLEGVPFPSQTITAAARYPYQPAGSDVAASGSITKNINNLFSKTLVCTRKNNVSGAIAYICTVTAQDINGDGGIFNGEKVCFSREPDNIWYDVGGHYPHQNGYCVELSGGDASTPATASVETPATLVGSPVDVQAAFVDEHLLRDACIISGAPASTPGPCGGTGGTTTTGTTTTGTTTTGTTTTGSTTTGTTSVTSLPQKKASPNVPKAKASASIVSVQLVAKKSGRVLMVKIHSPKKVAKIQIRLINAKGKVITVVVRTVKANKRVQVPNLRIAQSVKSVRVRIIS